MLSYIQIYLNISYVISYYNMYDLILYYTYYILLDILTHNLHALKISAYIILSITLYDIYYIY